MRSIYFGIITLLTLIFGSTFVSAGAAEQWTKDDLIPYILMHVQEHYKQQPDDIDITYLDLEGQQHFALYKASFSNTHLFFKFFRKINAGESTTSFESEGRLIKQLKAHSITNESIAYYFHQELIPHPTENMVMTVYPFINGKNLEVWLDDNSAPARISDPRFLRESSKAFWQYGKIMGEVAKKTYSSTDGEGVVVHIADRHLRNIIWDKPDEKIYLVDFNFTTNGEVRPLSKNFEYIIREMYTDMYSALIDWDGSEAYNLKLNCGEWGAFSEAQRQESQCANRYGSEANLMTQILISFVKGYLSEIDPNAGYAQQMYSEIKAGIEMSSSSENDYIHGQVRQHFSELFPL